MRIVLFTLLVFSIAVAVSSANPLEKDESPSIITPALEELYMSLSKRKPPGKIPGPKLLIENPMGADAAGLLKDDSEFRSLADEGKENKKKKTAHLAEEKKYKLSALSKDDKEKGNGNGKGKGKNKDLIQPETHNVKA